MGLYCLIVKSFSGLFRYAFYVCTFFLNVQMSYVLYCVVNSEVL